MVTVSFPSGTTGIHCCVCGGKAVVTRTELRCSKCGETAPNAWVPKESDNPANQPDAGHRIGCAVR